MSKLGLTAGEFVILFPFRASIYMVSSSTSLQLLNTFVYFSNCTYNSCAVITSSSFQYLFLLFYFFISFRIYPHTAFFSTFCCDHGDRPIAVDICFPTF